MQITEKLESQLKSAPTEPGCYIFKDSKGDILYIGKAVNLRNRSSSYFRNYKRLDPRITQMVDRVETVEYFTVDSETEALILETNLIKKYQPKYNRLMKDDKNYSWVMIDWYKDYPSICVVREKDDPRAEYYGPYPARFPIFQVLKRLRKVFPYCNKLPSGINTDSKRFTERPCFDYHIEMCSGVCAGIATKEEHRKNISSIKRFFKGQKAHLVENLKNQMSRYSLNNEFEKAAEVRDRIKDLEYVTQRIKIGKDIDEVKLMKMKKELAERALEDLIMHLKIDALDVKKNFKIECYDISNIQGTNAVGSMVVFVNGKPKKEFYRKFKIRTKNTPDDFAMMQEVLARRLKYLKLAKGEVKDQSFAKSPDLIIVDGGKGQLSSAYSTLKEKQLVDDIAIVGLAKREEEIFKICEENNFEMVKLPRRSEALYLVQRIRDEAHRFAIGYHRKLRSRMSTKSILDDVPGVGKVIKQRLLKAFGSVESIKKAKRSDLESVVRNTKTVDNIAKVLNIST